ncbi:MAG TPA: hypothetical protein VKU86_15535 [Acidimicrobiales bacterium]|nr:hypothetical protein [Acidimicrobiales bacterium]
MTPEEAVRATKDAVVGLPAGFMMAGYTYKRAAESGFEGIDFYFAGRAGPLGDVDSAVVAAALVFFNPDAVKEAWERSAKVMARRDAVALFTECLTAWATRRLPEVVDHTHLAELLGRVNSHASVAAVPLFAAWRAMPEPGEPRALALHRLNVLRELRGGLHGAAVVAAGIEPRDAVVLRTPFMTGVFGWPEPHPDVSSCQASWEQAEAATERAVARAYAVLDEGELSELVDLLTAADKGTDRS